MGTKQATATDQPTRLRLAVCLFPKVCALDFVGPMEVLSFLYPEWLATGQVGPSPYAITVTYLSTTRDPVRALSALAIAPDASYEETTEQFDVILVPGGTGTRPGICPQSLIDFVKRQAPGAQYVLSVCTGSEVLAYAGVLQGKRATTNKSVFNRVLEETRELGITWVPKARWVVDGKIWTSSGVTAGTDMGYAFLEKLVGSAIASNIRGIVELSIKKEDEDEFAEYYGLV